MNNEKKNKINEEIIKDDVEKVEESTMEKEKVEDKKFEQETEEVVENQYEESKGILRKVFSNRAIKIAAALVIFVGLVGGSVKAIEEYREYKMEGGKIEFDLFDDDDDSDCVSGATSKGDNADSKEIENKDFSEEDKANIEKIKEVIASDLGTEVDKLKFTKIKTDTTDDYMTKEDKTRKKVYEIEVISDNTEHEFEIDYTTLEVLKKEID